MFDYWYISTQIINVSFWKLFYLSINVQFCIYHKLNPVCWLLWSRQFILNLKHFSKLTGHFRKFQPKFLKLPDHNIGLLTLLSSRITLAQTRQSTGCTFADNRIIISMSLKLDYGIHRKTRKPLTIHEVNSNHAIRWTLDVEMVYILWIVVKYFINQPNQTQFNSFNERTIFHFKNLLRILLEFFVYFGSHTHTWAWT